MVTVDRPITPKFIEEMSSGVPILGVNTKKCKIHAESEFVFRITLIQGMNRQIRRMCEHFGYEVLRLERVRIMNLTLKGIPLGDYREMRPVELAELKQLIESSEKIKNPNKMTKTPGLKDAERSMHIARSLQRKKTAPDEDELVKSDGKVTPVSNPKSKSHRKSATDRKRGGGSYKGGRSGGGRPGGGPGGSRRSGKLGGRGKSGGRGGRAR